MDSDNLPSSQPGSRPTGRARARLWVEGARLRTLPLAIGPVALGTGAATFAGAARPVLALFCLVIALALQIGVNYANDYSDGIRGTDDVRVGPPRLTASGAVKPETVRTVAFGFFFIAAIVGAGVVVASGAWWLLIAGAAAIAAAWFYTGGTHPYGYHGLGEVFVFIFFGLVAVMGTTYVQKLALTPLAAWAAVGAGSYACAVLMVNNIRDIEQDAIAGKRTLAVVVGGRWARVLYVLFVAAPFVVLLPIAMIIGAPAMLALSSLPLPLLAVMLTLRPRGPRDALSALQLTSFASLAYALFLGFGMFIAVPA